MRKFLSLTLLLLLTALAIAGWVILGPGTAFSTENKSFYVHTGKTDQASILQSLSAEAYVKHPKLFAQLATQLRLWDNPIKPGRYELKQGYSLYHFIRDLQRGHTTPIKFVLTNVRTKEELAGKIGKFFEPDSLDVIRFLNNPDSTARFSRDTNNILSTVIPDTYFIDWNSTSGQVMHRFHEASQLFWTEAKRDSASQLGLTPVQVYILASIVEEETHKDGDKPLIASVYLNRLAKGMRLAADPTIKFALRDFDLKRIYDKYTKVVSPYNTYLYKGLPPGPICTPSIKTLEATLQAPKTDYLYFVAKADFSGHSVFAADYPTHLRNAKAYQEALDSLMKNK